MRKDVLKLIVTLCLLLCSIAYSDAGTAVQEQEQAPKKEFTIIKEVWRTPYKSQGKTGTCWSFSTTSLLESEAYRLGRGELELSQIYIAYHAYLEKAQRNVRMHGHGVFKQGGLPHDVIHIMKKYGTVRLTDYSGLLPGDAAHNHREMYKLLNGVMKSVVEVGKGENLSSKWIDGKLSSRWLDDMKDILDNHTGPVPKSIQYKGRKMTPKEFADEVLALPYDDYIEVTSYSFLPLYGTGELTIQDNWLHYSNYYNVKIDQFIGIIDHALENGFSLVFDLHTTTELYKSKKGYCELEPELEAGVIDQDARDTMLENWRTFDQHLVHGVGIAKDEKGKKFYFTKDSVGPEDGPYKSLEYFSENYIRAKALFIMVHKDGLPRDIRKKLGID
ncbi:MAG: hypothetical protein GTO51_08860 [Candidatus Latescibacteria bacterium]|nr:hypothetical protein [Candidatus Latescibacterota bacterium]NIM22061.1 hypothetical protein [Candidatus Latescibacterota bacterium]NIM66080.1 hypothetical protein [Candidatus Latescibacterota bacterium]NIO02488.1 hypothetical protein [Candidatus Latescibacterota bacterium]NIO29399.1 hypothetical protein [Candidatus Latescibacterota bacterium]